MSRRYSDPVEVRVGVVQIGRQLALPAGLDAASVPTAFIWRGRLHIVRAVLDHWTQRLPWWRVPWGEEASEGGLPQDRAVQDGAVQDDAVQDGAAVALAVELEREVWRVEASTGRLMQTGVYDLTRDDRWRLVRVAD